MTAGFNTTYPADVKLEYLESYVKFMFKFMFTDFRLLRLWQLNMLFATGQIKLRIIFLKNINAFRYLYFRI